MAPTASKRLILEMSSTPGPNIPNEDPYAAMWGMVVTSTFDLLWPYPTLQHTGPRIVCNVGGRLFSHRNRREKFVFRRQSERAQAEFVGRLGQ